MKKVIFGLLFFYHACYAGDEIAGMFGFSLGEKFDLSRSDYKKGLYLGDEKK